MRTTSDAIEWLEQNEAIRWGRLVRAGGVPHDLLPDMVERTLKIHGTAALMVIALGVHQTPESSQYKAIILSPRGLLSVDYTALGAAAAIVWAVREGVPFSWPDWTKDALIPIGPGGDA